MLASNSFIYTVCWDNRANTGADRKCLATAANGPLTWKPLLGMQTVAAPPGGQTEYWQKHQHATWLNVLQENQNTNSSTTLYRSTPDSTTLCTAVLTEVQHVQDDWPLSHCKQRHVFKGFLWLLLHRPRPQIHKGRGFSFKPNLLRPGSTSAVLLLKRNTEISVPLWLMRILTASSCQWRSMLSL